MCGPLFLTVAGICLLSVGTCVGFLTAALFAAGAEPAQLVEAKTGASIPDETAEVVRQAAESLYILASRLREGKDSLGPMADAARALHVVGDRLPVLLRNAGCTGNDGPGLDTTHRAMARHARNDSYH
jgi:hypothetical protein